VWKGYSPANTLTADFQPPEPCIVCGHLLQQPQEMNVLLLSRLHDSPGEPGIGSWQLFTAASRVRLLCHHHCHIVDRSDWQSLDGVHILAAKDAGRARMVFLPWVGRLIMWGAKRCWGALHMTNVLYYPKSHASLLGLP
jgi:hypothetical protein